jgi:hypothetical protein
VIPEVRPAYTLFLARNASLRALEDDNGGFATSPGAPKATAPFHRPSGIQFDFRISPPSLRRITPAMRNPDAASDQAGRYTGPMGSFLEDRPGP